MESAEAGGTARMNRFVFAFAVAALAAMPSNAQQACEKLKGLTLPGVTITLAASVPAGQFTLPSGPTRNAPPKVPAFCRVAGVVTPEVKFELWMPAAWNKKLLGSAKAGSLERSPTMRWSVRCRTAMQRAARIPGTRPIATT
jgi:hypothetical protein